MKYSLNILIFLALILTSISCQSAPALGEVFELATSTENKVEVAIMLERTDNDQFILSATFTPQDPGLHLYSKEIPKTGVDGLGRPTLLELSTESSIQAVSELVESTLPQTPATAPFELLTYPAGPITLSLQIVLPDGNNWVKDEIMVTYMACDEQGCRPPVEGKAIAIQIPGKGVIKH